MNDQVNRELANRLIQGLDTSGDGHDPQDQMNEQYFNNEDQMNFQRYLEPNPQLIEQKFEYMDPNELPGSHYGNEDNDLVYQQDESMQRDLLGEQELIQIGSNEETGSSAAYQRSRPDGSPMFSQSSGFVPGDGESVVFRPIKQLDFNSLDETGLTDVILPRGMDRSASTPDHKGSRSISMISREQFIENSGIDRNESPDGNFYELKSSPNHSEQEGELDSKVIFSPLHGLNDFQEEQFDPGMKSPPLSKLQNVRQNMPQNFSPGNAAKQNYMNENFELSQRPINETGISPYQNDSLEQENHYSSNSPQRSAQPVGRASRSPKYSPNHGQSPHHHSISPSRRHFQTVETREIFVSVPQHNQFQSPDSLNQSGGGYQKNDVSNGQSPYERSTASNSWSQQQYITAMAPSGQQGQMNPIKTQNNDPQKMQYPVSQNSNNVSNKQQNDLKLTGGQGGQPASHARMQDAQAKDANRVAVSTSSNKQAEVKPNEKKPWNYAKGSGNRDPDSYMEKGAQKREILAQNAKARMVREEPKGRAQEKNNPQPANKAKRMSNGQSTENLNKSGSVQPANRNQQPNIAQNKPGNGYGSRAQPNEGNNRFSGIPVAKGNKGEQGKQMEMNNRSREPPKQKETYSPVTQVEQYSDAHDSTLDVQGMEDVRSQLKNMLKISTGESMLGGKSFDFNNDGDVNVPMSNADHFPGNVDYSVISGNSQDNVSELLENFPSITACMWTDNSSINRNDVSVHNENTRLREILEKERYRRKHCEQQIQKLNIKHLETQQQLAVAVSTDKRKDIMIEQLDKQLGKVLEGWKQQDHEKTVTLEKSRQEKKKLEDTIAKQQEIINSFEKDMAEALEVVRRERDDAESSAEELKSQIEENERNRRHAEEMLETEREKSSLTKQELDMIKDNRDQMDKKYHQLQDRMYQEQDNWFKREQELLNKIDEVSESNLKVLQQEKDKNEELSNRNKQMDEEIHEIQKIIKKMEMEYDAVQREKESLKVEMGIMEAKFESSQRTLEAELASQMEKEIAEQMSELQKRVEKADTELRDKHFEHTKELNQRHKEDLEKHLANFHRQLQDKDDENRRQIQEYEEKLQAYRSEINSLQDSKQKLEKQRTDILLKLQQMMQSQWNEALSLLATTPQRKRGPPKVAPDNKPSSKLDLSLPQNSNSDTVQGNALNMSDLASLGNFSASQRGSNPSSARDDIPVSTEVNLTDFQASLHMQQLLQSLSSLTTQPFPAFGHSSVSSQVRDVHQDPHQTVPITHRSNSSQEESRPGSYPPSPNAKQSNKVNSRSHQHGNSIQNTSQVPNYPGSPNRKQHVQQGNEGMYHNGKAGAPNPAQQSNLDYSQPVYLAGDENDEFNTHLQMLLNVNRPPVVNLQGDESVNYGRQSVPNVPRDGSLNYGRQPVVNVPRDESLDYGQDSSTSKHFVSARQSQRQKHETVDQWLRQSQTSQKHFNQGQSEDLNRSHASHVSSQPDSLIGQLGMAVPIRPPQQHESFVSHPDAEIHPPSSQFQDMSQGGFNPSVCYSPPTKQTRTQALQQDPDPLLDESVRLTKDYHNISNKVEEHEFRQGELQHYIQMLLQKPPGSVADPDEMASLFSHDQTEDLDMNDTAQAAQIQRELSRIQELREKPQGQDETDRKAVTVGAGQGSKAVGQSFQGVLQPEHLAEISRYLESHKDHMSGKTEDEEHLAEIVGLLKHMQKHGPQKPGDVKRPSSPKSPRDKVKKNLKGQMAKVADTSQSHPGPNKPQSQPKKERKVASVGPNRHIQGKGKNAWK